MTNPYLKRRGLREGTTTGHKAETKAARRFGATQTPASGALGVKGDYDLGGFKFENKATQADSYTLQHKTLGKISKEAAMEGKWPALALQYTDAGGQPVQDGAWVALPEHVFRRLLSGEES